MSGGGVEEAGSPSQVSAEEPVEGAGMEDVPLEDAAVAHGGSEEQQSDEDTHVLDDEGNQVELQALPNDDGYEIQTASAGTREKNREDEAATSSTEAAAENFLTWHSPSKARRTSRRHSIDPAMLSRFQPISTPTIADNNDEETHQRDDFVRRGARLRSLLQSAIRKVADSSASKSKEEPSRKRSLSITAEASEEPPARRPRTVDGRNDVFAAEVAREKTTECMMLKKALKEAEALTKSLEAENSSLRDAASVSGQRMERTQEALKIAGANAANARADADAAQARANSLSSQLKSLETVVEETKQACETVKAEHDEIGQAARSVEGRLVQAESELMRKDRDQRRLEEELHDWKDQALHLDQVRGVLETDLSKTTEGLNRSKKTLAEREAVEQARIDRTHRIDGELRAARAMLVEATSSAAETETTTALLNETIEELKRENRMLHDKVQEAQDNARTENSRLNEALAEAESEAQRLRMKTTSDREELERLGLDKAAMEKHVTQLKSRITNLERRLKDATSFSTTTDGLAVTPSPATDILGNLPPMTECNDKTASTTKKKNKRHSTGSYAIPPLKSTRMSPHGGGKENSDAAAAIQSGTVCSICYKRASGMMKSCQCGRPSCHKRAHALCLADRSATPSVSHPGTPAPRLPVVLCSGTDAA